MNHYPNQDRGLHSRRSAIELPYPPGSPIHRASPSQSNISARRSRGPELHRAKSIASYHSHHRQEQNRHEQRPITPPADLPTPPMSRQGSFDLNDQLYPSHVPQQYHQYGSRDYPTHEDSPVVLTPPSSPGTIFNDQTPSLDNGHLPYGGNDHQVETIYNGRNVYLNKVTYAKDGAQGRVEYYDPQGRLTDASGTVIIHEPEHVPHGQDREFDHQDEMNRRHHGHTKFIDTPTASQQFEAYDLEERHPATRDAGDQTPRQRSPISPRTKYRDDRDTKQSYTATLRKGDDRVSRLGHQVQEDRDTRYDPSMSTDTIKYAEKGRMSNFKPPRQPVNGSTRSYKREPSPAQSVSSLGSRYSAHSYHTKVPHRAPRTHQQESSESNRPSLSPGKRDRGQKNQSMTTRDRSLSPVERYQSHKHESERSRRSISPPRRDHGRRDIQIRSPDYSSSGSESDYSTPRRSKSGGSMALVMMFSPTSQKSRSRNSNDSWDKKTFSGPSPVEQTFAPATLQRRQAAMSETIQKSRVARLLRDLADSLEERGSEGGTKVSVVGLEERR